MQHGEEVDKGRTSWLRIT